MSVWKNSSLNMSTKMDECKLKCMCIFVLFLSFTPICVCQLFTELDFFDLKVKIGQMEEKIARQEMKDVQMQLTILEQAETIIRQSNFISDIKQDMEQHTADITKLEHDLKQKQTTINLQTTKISTLERRLGHQTRKMSILQKRCNTFIHDYLTTRQTPLVTQNPKSLQNQILDDQFSTTDGEDENMSKVSRYYRKQPKNKICRPAAEDTSGIKKRFVQSVEEPVAFMTSLSRALTDIRANQIILFDDIGLNMGGGYHANQGVFIVPKGGVYIFSATVISPSDSDISVSIVHKGNTVAHLYCHGESGHPTQASQTVVIKVDHGDTIWVRNNQSKDNTIFGYAFSTFSGYLLWPM